MKTHTKEESKNRALFSSKPWCYLLYIATEVIKTLNYAWHEKKNDFCIKLCYNKLKISID